MALLEFGYFEEALQRSKNTRDEVDRPNGGLRDVHLAFGDKLRQTYIEKTSSCRQNDNWNREGVVASAVLSLGARVQIAPAACFFAPVF